jgi:hypothetical protein
VDIYLFFSSKLRPPNSIPKNIEDYFFLNQSDEVLEWKMGQCSILVFQQRRTLLLCLLRRLLRLSDQKRKPVKVPAAIKVCIVDTLRSSVSTGGSPIGNGKASLRQSSAGESFLWACNGKGTSDTILVWHIATNIL